MLLDKRCDTSSIFAITARLAPDLQKASARIRFSAGLEFDLTKPLGCKSEGREGDHCLFFASEPLSWRSPSRSEAARRNNSACLVRRDH